MKYEAGICHIVFCRRRPVLALTRSTAARSYRFARLRASTPDPKRLAVRMWSDLIFDAGHGNNAET
jgi:hypothetical protein